MKIKSIATILFMLFCLNGFTQNFDKEKLDSYFKALEDNNKFMGTVAVSKNGSILYTKSIGFADVENNIKATEISKYRIGSITKTFTAVLVFKTVEEGKLDLNQRINTYFPSIKNAEKITIGMLLNHRSGLHNFTDDTTFDSWRTQAKTEKEMIELIAKGGSDFKPGSKSEYSNSNFVLLTFILQKTYNKSYADLLQEKIIQPIGLTNTYVFGKINTANNECKSYVFAGDWNVSEETDFTIPLGAGAIVSTTIDLNRFADALFGGRLLKKESLDYMKTIKGDYGYGLFQIPFYKSIGYGHTGGIDGFSSIFAHFEDSNISYSLTSNGANYENNEISIAVLSAIYNRPYEVPEFKTYTPDPADMDKYLGVYASKLIKLKITITKNGNVLFAQATGQGSFSLDPIGKHQFESAQVGAKIEFDLLENTLILHQGGAKVVFKKE